MKRMLALAVAFTFAVAHVSLVNAQLQGSGVITGTVSGSSGALGGATVQAIEAAGSAAFTAVTTGMGTFSIGGLRPGVYTVQVLGSNGQITGASSATLTTGTMTVTQDDVSGSR
jgi:hypothetical protein